MNNRLGKIYFCPICGNEVKFEKDGGGTLVCCGQEMQIKEVSGNEVKSEKDGGGTSVCCG